MQVLERDESEFARTQGYGIGIRQDGIYALAKIRMLPVFRKLVTPRNDSYFLTTAYDGTPLVTMCMKAASIPSTCRRTSRRARAPPRALAHAQSHLLAHTSYLCARTGSCDLQWTMVLPSPWLHPR
ncbi:hypothetical protein EON67_09355 [archaeon]|nr:MAG: hypothetical protein EON67_09355 [archaeon]